MGEKGLLSPFMLKSLFWINALGTVYGYYWYWGQLQEVWDTKPAWMVLLVPDSPTASLFFTLAIGWLWLAPERRLSNPNTLIIRSFVEVFAVVTSFKYGIWAVAMIFGGQAQGDILNWQHYMLVASHLGMAAEALLYARFFRVRPGTLAAVAFWTLYNDLADYRFGIYPYLPNVLDDDLTVIQAFTMLLSVTGLCLAWWICGRRKRSK
ncbi:DUF1405 domain-containing protein [Paenibacillus mesotrionivorans]|uniref:DUF1405 domain-containing protein n=1 Tax=Paenibacillus mesotrionivorans TaxID=3160968 RepID=A0ACC7NRM3_9BACL